MQTNEYRPYPCRVARGGSFNDNDLNVRATVRRHDVPAADHRYNIGLRCARDLRP
jgi:formylglycine-generating enzyme required for sulfatase activity